MRSLIRKMGFMAIALPIICLHACNNGNKPATAGSDTVSAATLNIPDFNADSAYQSVEQQISYGPRTPGSAAQQQCAVWMEAELKKVCDTVYKQAVTVKGGDGKMLPCINLVGVIHPKATRRILLLTHWDSRPWADMDTAGKDKPVLAADDGGSGVGVLIEIARQIKAHTLPSEQGVDLLLTDVEDYGKSEWGDDSYCLGTQYWAHHPHVAGYKADCGILLDMVGAQNAQFPLEGISAHYAGEVQKRVWQAAVKAGYSSFFPFATGAEIIDDHVAVNKITGIPTIDIINLNINSEKVFAPHWHTHQDNMQIIDRSTLKAVGQTILEFIYETAKSG